MLPHINLFWPRSAAAVLVNFQTSSEVLVRVFRAGLVLFLLAVMGGIPLFAQTSPRIGYAYPAGGRQGTTFEMTVGGQFLDGVTNAYVSGTGIRAKITGHKKPLTMKQYNQLREQLRELLEKRGVTRKSENGGQGQNRSQKLKGQLTASDFKRIAELRKKIEENRPNKQANPALAERVTLAVTVDAQGETGTRELRLGTPVGLSNPLVFKVGQIAEFVEKDLKKQTNEIGRTIDLPAVLNGQILPGEADRFRFRAQRRDQVVIAVSARSLMPYLADAVPGWFQAAVTLYDSTGRELAYADDYRFNPDPVLFYDIPEEGEYVLEIKDALYRGREDFVYRVELGDIPFITSIFPLGAPAGQKTSVEVQGWNLPVTNLTVSPKQVGTESLMIRKAGLFSNIVPFVAGDLPECLEIEDGDARHAQQVNVPQIVNGRIDRPGDVDVFEFTGRAGQKLVADIYARRLGSPVDSVLKVTDHSGRQVAANDDHDDKGTGLNTHHADSWVCFTLPQTGKYFVQISDAQHKGGSEYVYRLRISAPQPDFELRVVPSTISVRAGACLPVTVYALRKDGFSGDISLALKNAPKGCFLSGGDLPSGQESVRVTITAPPQAYNGALTLQLEGQASMDDQKIVRKGVPADDMMQAFFYRHLVPAKEMKMVVMPSKWVPRSPAQIVSNQPVKIPVGGTGRVRISTALGALLERVKLELSEPPEGISIKNVTPSRNGGEIEFQADAKAKAGTKGNLIVNAFAAKTDSKTNKFQPTTRRAPVGTLPAIPFEIVAK